MDDETTIDERTAAFLDEVRSTFAVGAPPQAGPALTTLFAAGLTDTCDLPATAAIDTDRSGTHAAGPPNRTRRIAMVKELLGQLGSKVAAGTVGAAMAITGLGMTGALGAPMRMVGISAEDDAVVEDDATDDATEDDATDDEATDEEEVVEVVDDSDEDEAVVEDEVDEEAPGVEDDAAMAAVPTSVSEAAHVHDFDEACGNHGMYVSYFAQNGSEPPCATEARAATPADGGAGDEGTETATVEEQPETDRQEAKARARADRKEAKSQSKPGNRGGGGRGRGK